MKKTLTIIGIVAIIAGAIWFFLKEDVPLATNTPSGGAPFGSGDDIVNIPTQNAEAVNKEISLDEMVTAETKLLRISNAPVSGFGMFLRGGETIVRFVERSTGHIFEATLPKVSETKNLDLKKITNNTLPKIYEAYFRNDGGVVLLRFIEDGADTIKNLSLTLTPPRGTSTSTSDSLYSVSATNLRGGMDSVVVGTNNLTYVLKDSASIVTSGFNGENQRTLFSSNFSDWRLGKLGTNFLVYTKASGSADGYAFSLPSGGGSLNKLLGPLKGLIATANNNGTKILYSYFDGSTKMGLKDLSDGSDTQILPATLVEKCVWSPKNNNAFYCGIPIGGISSFEPDNWYLGRSYFIDYIWKFDTLTEASTLVAQPKTDYGVDMDVSELKLSPNEDYLLFINKLDLTLWAVKLN